MEKILFTATGSAADPKFTDLSFQGVPSEEYMRRLGITMYSDVESCHGCFDIMTKYSQQFQTMVDSGKRVASVLGGGMLFGLSSLQATQVTYPIISSPMDNVAFTAFLVPSGHACVAGVGVEAQGAGTQRFRALTLAQRILGLEDQHVYIAEDTGGKLSAELRKLGIDASEKYRDAELAVSYGNNPDRPYNKLLLWADSDQNLKSWEWLQKAEGLHQENSRLWAQVSGAQNLAIYTAKVLSLQNPKFKDVIKDIKDKKRATYTQTDFLGGAL